LAAFGVLKNSRALACGSPPIQISTSFNRLAGTLRGLHWQTEPYAETKLVRVIRGCVWDVAVDLRPNSSTRLAWFGRELDATNHLAMMIPPGFGFVTMADDTEVLSLIDVAYHTDGARGARHDDPAIGIDWPRSAAIISDRDGAWPPFTG
jgi:dTDP-4-dehydrorhamnose 3,5-epimerase